jgi:hypothetical protein
MAIRKIETPRICARRADALRLPSGFWLRGRWILVDASKIKVFSGYHGDRNTPAYLSVYIAMRTVVSLEAALLIGRVSAQLINQTRWEWNIKRHVVPMEL